MRKCVLFSFIFLVFCSASISYAQFDLLKKVKDKVEKNIEEEVDKSIDKGIDETKDASKDGGEKGAQEDKQSEAESPKETGKEESSSSSTGDKEKLQAWSKYDFVPGDQIIFQDDLMGEENGEFPSRWDLYKGNIEIARYGDENVINFATTQSSSIVPLMDQEGDYLPEKFTIEFDAYFSEFCTNYDVSFWDMISQKPQKYIPVVHVKPDYVSVEGFSGTELEEREYPFFEHISISFNTRALKVYFGEKRVMNIPNLRAEPMGLTITSSQCHQGKQALIKNIRIAQGSKELYDRIISDGKFVTSGILFDVNKATLKPESMGVINQIVKMMNSHQDLRLSIEGHTDSDGDENWNQELSEKRAASVKETLVERGIESSRLETKGYGESKPVDSNSTAEGKANNRRVEFVKI